MPGKGKQLDLSTRDGTMTMRIGFVLMQIADEVDQQYMKWGVQDHNHGYVRSKYSARDEERIKEMVDTLGPLLTWRDIINEEVAEAVNAGEDERVYEELVQVAACVVSCLENMARRSKAHPLTGTTEVIEVTGEDESEEVA